jgi:hypothetical protein
MGLDPSITENAAGGLVLVLPATPPTMATVEVAITTSVAPTTARSPPDGGRRREKAP